MRSLFMNPNRLASIADVDERKKALFEAIGREFSLPRMFADLGGGDVSPQSGIKVIGMRGADIRMPSEEQVKGYLQQKWAVPSDTPNLSSVAGQIVSYFHTNMPEVDNGWQQLFTLVDMRDSVQDHFEIIDTNLGITFSQLKPGAEIKVRRNVSEDVTTVKYLTYGDGIGILDDWIRFQKFWNIQQAIMEFQAKAQDNLASSHYQLLTALGNGINVAFDTDDTKTLNKAAATILRSARGKGYAAGPNAGFVIVCSPEMVGRVTKMLTASAGTLIVAYNANVQPVNVHVSAVVATTYVAANDTGYYLVLPGRKLQRGTWKDLTIESARNGYFRATDWMGVQQYNAAIGDQAQVARVLYS
jgi:hypothetical protein